MNPSNGRGFGPPRSTFVTVLAWIFIVLGGFATFVGVVQNVMIRSVFPRAEMVEAMNRSDGAAQVPAVAKRMMLHMDLFFLLVLLASATTFVSAIGLLKRKDWERRVFMGLMVLGIGLNLLALVLPFTSFSPLHAMPAGDEVPPSFLKATRFMQAASVVIMVGVSALFAFIVKKLCSRELRGEFS